MVKLADAGPVAVFSVHLKCCGYVGSEEDDERMWQAHQLAQVIENLRSGNAGSALLPYADVPVLVAGDFNDVGSPELREILTVPDAANLTRLPLPHLVGSDVFTWYYDEASFHRARSIWCSTAAT